MANIKTSMRFDKIRPSERFKPYVRYFVIAESADERTYKVFPSAEMVIGFQYRGRLATVRNGAEELLATAGITGLMDGFKMFKNAAGTGTVLVYFTETGIASFSNCPANELFNHSISLDNLFDKDKIAETEEKLALAINDQEKIALVEQFLASVIQSKDEDKLVTEAVKLICQSKGSIRIRELNEKLSVSQSPLEKRFRKIVGTSPKKFASIVRFNAVLKDLERNKPLTAIGYENNFFDQAHFIRDFRQYTGDAPENFRRFL